jgi:hypothetical protein
MTARRQSRLGIIAAGPMLLTEVLHPASLSPFTFQQIYVAMKIENYHMDMQSSSPHRHIEPTCARFPSAA